MIIKGKSRAGPQQLAKHLTNVEKNERVKLLEVKGTVAQDLRGALVEMDAYAVGTRCEKPLYHLAMSPALPHRLSPEQLVEAVDAVEEKLGLTGHARVIVLHEKLGRQHIHIVWSRIDIHWMTAASDSHNYRKHEEVARDLERRFGHERVQGAHHERDGVERPERTPSRAELQQQERTGITGKMVKEEVTAAFRASDGPEAFRAALEERGYMLARGDRRDHVIIDPLGGVHSLARRIDGMKAAELREFMAPIEKESLPSIGEAREVAADREQRARELLAAEQRDSSIEKAYARGDDYVSQTQAALKDHQARQEKLQQGEQPEPKATPIEIDPAVLRRDEILDQDDREPRQDRLQQRDEAKPTPSAIEVDTAALKREEILDQYDRERRQAREEVTERKDSSATATGTSPDNVEMTDEKRDRLDRFIDTEAEEREVDRDDWDPDRQREAPGGGRTRSR